jgi:hypothetical protein
MTVKQSKKLTRITNTAWHNFMEINSDFTFLYPDFENKWIVLLDHKKVLYSTNNLDELSYALHQGELNNGKFRRT